MNKKMRIFRLLASHPIFLFKLNKSGFDECYQSAIKWEFEKSKSQYFQGFAGPHIHFLLIQTLYSHLYFVSIQILFSIYSIIISIILYYFGVFQFFYRHFRDLINAELQKIKAKSFKIQKIHCHIKKIGLQYIS